MSNNHREDILKIRNDFQASQRVKDSLNNSIQALARDLYSKDTHFIFELIQNAEDNSYQAVKPSLSFLLSKEDPTATKGSDGVLIIQNNEIGFSLENIEAICAVGQTTKRKIQGYIGEKGIGFKSVFRVTSNPHIFSNGYNFCLPEHDADTGLGYIVPQWVNQVPRGIDPSHTSIILPLDRDGFSYSEIEKMLRDIEPETILFLSKLKEIKIETNTGDALIILKDDHDLPHVQIILDGLMSGKPFSEVNKFLLCSGSYNRPATVSHEKRIDIDKRDCSIAFPIGNNRDSIGKLFAYLPVRSDTGFPFLINADFILPSSREEIRDNIPWNRWLMDCVAELIAGALPQLKENNLLTVDLFESFASRAREISENDIFYPIVVSVREVLMNEALLPTDDGTFVSARNAKLASAEWLRKLLQGEQIRQLFKAENALSWISGEITERAKSNLWRYIRDELQVEEVTPDSFARKLDDLFLKKRSDDWFVEFYGYLSGQEALWRSPLWKGDAGGLLRAKPILRLQDNSLKEPFQSDGKTANAFLPPPEETDFPIVKRSIANDGKVRDFLIRLGLSEPDVFDDIVTRVLPKYIRSGASWISPNQHASDIQEILRALRADSEAGKKKVIEAAKQTPFLKAINLYGKAAFQKPADIYSLTQDLKDYFLGSSDVWFLVETEGEKEWRELGVEKKPRFKKIPNSLTWEDKRRLMGKQQHTRDIEDSDYDLDGLENFLSRLSKGINPSDRYPLILWNFLLAHLKENSYYRFYEGEYKWFYYHEQSVTFDATWKKQIRGYAWLPKNGDIVPHLPSELRIVDLPDSFNRDDKLADLLGMKKDVVAILAEEAGIQAEDIEMMRQHPEEFQQWKAEITARKEKPIFPTRTSQDQARRQERLTEQLQEALEKEYRELKRSVRVTRGSVGAALWLRNQYKNNEDQIVCQICKEEMPFKKRNGDYYFESVEILSKDYLPKEHEAQYLALCPECAARYTEFVKRDESAMKTLSDALKNSAEPQVPLNLGELETSIQFVESHWQDIKTTLQEEG